MIHTYPSPPLAACDNPDHYHILCLLGGGFNSDPTLGKLQTQGISYKNVNKLKLDPFIIILIVVYFIRLSAWSSFVLLSLSSLQVEFPDARIYEETLNILLYENRTGPDQELMQATSTRGVVAGMSSYTSDDEEERSGLARLRSNKQNNP